MYSVGPADPHGQAAADGLGDKTMMVPPPTPSWAPQEAPQGAVPFDQPPPLAAPLMEAPPAPQGPGPVQPGPQPALQQQGPPPEPPQQAAGMLAPTDPESTAAWTFNPDEPSGGFATPPPPTWADGSSAAPLSPAGSQPHGGVASFGADRPPAFGAQPLPEPESIVPESWYAQPRKPQEPEAEATQVWTPQQPAAGQGWGAAPPGAGAEPPVESTMLDGGGFNGGPYGGAPGPMGNPGTPLDEGTRLDFNPALAQTQMVPGQTVQAQFGQDQFAQGQYGQDQYGPGQFGQGPMGPGTPPPMGGNPMGPAGPGFDGGYPGHAAPSKRGGPGKPLIIGVSALVTVAVAAVGFVLWPSGGKGAAGAKPVSPTPANTKVAQTNKIPSAARQQAGAMNEILNASVDTRRVLNAALSHAGTCKDLPTAIQGFQTVAQRRQNQLRRNHNLKLDKVQNGERLRGSLRQALQASLDVDQVLLQWAQRNQRKCKGKPRPDAAHVPGRAPAEQRATQAKRQFVVLWNPVAKNTDLPSRDWQRV
ncbi:hypothetical protein [Actinomadura roseirufa]|uniref:hypothetical protein n=1 Tax=Actinomadura roseirufa TaxID=2094049 RepID=UPI001041074C|nr:hypothetical protein [Actinomadura roseirufa]